MKEELNRFGEVKKEVNLKDFNTFKLSSVAKYVVLPKDKNQLLELIKYLKTQKVKYFILGGGSNIIINGSYYDGVIIKLDKLNKVEVNETEIVVEAGIMFNKLANYLIEHNLKGLEWATGIPGTLGGSIVSNAGAYNSEIMDFITEIYALKNEKFITIPKKDISYTYRHTMFKDDKDFIILGAKLKLEKGNKEESSLIVLDRLKRRMASQPLEYPSAGSVFRNPPEMYAGKLIEDLGLKGYTVNGARISEKHANFIINFNNATSQDIINIINKVKKEVKKEYKIDLITEQEIINW